MSVIAERTAQVAERRELVEAHCMCAKMDETPHSVTVYYPVGYFPNGARVATTGEGGKFVALGRLLDVMERHWKESML